MASAAEQMAANTSWRAFGQATELRQRILFTIGILIVYRIGTYIPVPGIDGAALRQFMEDAASGIGGMLSMFAAGALVSPSPPWLAVRDLRRFFLASLSAFS